MIQNSGAKGEAFGYYFDQDGNVVHGLRTIGIQTESFRTNSAYHFSRRWKQ